MPANDSLLFRQLQVIQKIIHDETWLEGERRGRAVSPDDPVVRENVCRVILRIGGDMREAALSAIAREQRALESVRAAHAAEPGYPFDTHRSAAA